MRVAASTSSPLVSPISGLSTAPAKWPARVEPFHAGDQGVFMGAVQGVARLESDDALPALFDEEGARLARRQDKLAIFGVLGLRQDVDLAAQRACRARRS